MAHCPLPALSPRTPTRTCPGNNKCVYILFAGVRRSKKNPKSKNNKHRRARLHTFSCSLRTPYGGVATAPYHQSSGAVAPYGMAGGTAVSPYLPTASSPTPPSTFYPPLAGSRSAASAPPLSSSPFSSATGSLVYGRSLSPSPSPAFADVSAPASSSSTTATGHRALPSTSSSPTSVYSGAPMSLPTGHLKRESSAPYSIPTWEQKEREFREQQATRQPHQHPNSGMGHFPPHSGHPPQPQHTKELDSRQQHKSTPGKCSTLARGCLSGCRSPYPLVRCNRSALSLQHKGRCNQKACTLR